MEFKPGHTVGIDLGTTFSTMAQLDGEGNPVPIANEDDDVETASLILLADSGHVVVGPNRQRAAMEDPEHVVERVKRYMGNTDFKRTFDGREITPEFLSALILKKLRQDGEKRIGKIGNAVITVPYYFNDARRKATEDAGRIAGLNVIDIINEPTAATLTYAWTRGELGAVSGTPKPHLALVYDLGGGTFDVTVVRYTPSHFQVLATDGDVHLGGIDWNDRIVDYVAEEFKAKHGADPRESPAALHVLRHDADQAKITLSETNVATVPCRHGGKMHNVQITREQFEDMTADLLQRTIDTALLVMEQAEVKPEELDAIVLVGGSTLMPRVPAMLEQQLGKEPFQRAIAAHVRGPGGGDSRGDPRSPLSRRIERHGRAHPQAAGQRQARGRQLARPGRGGSKSQERQDDQPPDDPPQQQAAHRGAPHVRHQRTEPAAGDDQGDGGRCTRPGRLFALGQLPHHGVAKGPAQGFTD